MHTEHVFVDKQTPSVYQALVGVSQAVFTAAKQAELPRSLVELVNVRVSQLNGCPTCLETHHRKALAAGVTDKQLATVSVWRDVDLFSEREQAALRLAELVTTLPDHDTAEREYGRARAVFTDDELSTVIWVAVTINSFNRVSILSRHPVGP
jgi:AhpD family alkylhydroperoxidase